MMMRHVQSRMGDFDGPRPSRDPAARHHPRLRRRLARMARFATFLAWLLVASAILCGCSLSKANPEKRAFLLRAARPAEADGTAGSGRGVVLVRDITAASAFEGREMVLRTGESEFVSDFYNEFFASPGRMLSSELRRWVSTTPLFDAVVEPGSRLKAGYTLEGALTALYADIREPKNSKAVVGISFLLLSEDSSGAQRLLLDKDYRIEKATAGSSAEALVQGWNEALAALFVKLESDLAPCLPAR